MFLAYYSELWLRLWMVNCYIYERVRFYRLHPSRQIPMPLLLKIIHAGSLILPAVVAPLVLLLAYVYKRQFSQVIFHWRKPQVVYFTIGAFVLILSLFLTTCFFFAGHFGRIQLTSLELSSTEMWQLTVDSLLLAVGVVGIYIGAKDFLLQYTCADGILIERFNWRRLRMQYDYIFWQDIKDYYVRSDYPITCYHFIIQSDETVYARRSLKVPFYALAEFDDLLETNLNQQREKRALTREMIRKISRNMHD